LVVTRYVRLPIPFRTAPGRTGEPECLRSFVELDEDDVRLLEAVSALRPGVAALARKAREALDDDCHAQSLRSLEKSGTVARVRQAEGPAHEAAIGALMARAGGAR
jgi:hypothetical protein